MATDLQSAVGNRIQTYSNTRLIDLTARPCAWIWALLPEPKRRHPPLAYLTFCVTATDFNPGPRPFWLVYSVVQALVARFHCAQPSDRCAISGIWPWLRSLVELDLVCLEAVSASHVRLTRTWNVRPLVQQYDRQFYCNLFFLSTSFFLCTKQKPQGV